MKVKTGTLAPTTVNGNTTAVDLTPAGFSASEPLRAVIIFASYRTATGAADGSMQWSHGWFTNDGGTIQQGYQSAFSLDAAATSDCARGTDTTFCLKAYNAGTPVVDYTAACTVFSSTGFTLTWADAPTSAIIVSYIAIGGSDVTAARAFAFQQATTGTAQNVTVNTGFGQPDLVLLAPHLIATLGDSTASAQINLSAFTKAGGQRQSALYDTDNKGVMATVAAQESKAITTLVDSLTPAIAQTATVSAAGSWPTDGFQVTWNATPTVARQILALAIKTTAPVTIGSSTVPTGATLTQSLSHGSSIPQGAILWGSDLATAAGLNSAAADLGSFHMGVFDGTSQSAQGTCQKNADSVASTGRWYDNTKALQIAAPVASGTNPPAIKSQASAAVVGNGVDLTFTAADTVAREFNYMLFGSAGGTPPPASAPQRTLIGVGT